MSGSFVERFVKQANRDYSRWKNLEWLRKQRLIEYLKGRRKSP